MLIPRALLTMRPGIRDWLTTNAWIVNIVVIVYFIFELVK